MLGEGECVRGVQSEHVRLGSEASGSVLYICRATSYALCLIGCFVFICLPCSGQWKEYKRVYEHILETDKKLDQSRKNLVSQPTDL